MWRVVDVQRWMQALAQVEDTRREKERAFAIQQGIPLGTKRKTFALANKNLGCGANALLKDAE